MGKVYDTDLQKFTWDRPIHKEKKAQHKDLNYIEKEYSGGSATYQKPEGMECTDESEENTGEKCPNGCARKERDPLPSSLDPTQDMKICCRKDQTLETFATIECVALSHVITRHHTSPCVTARHHDSIGMRDVTSCGIYVCMVWYDALHGRHSACYALYVSDFPPASLAPPVASTGSRQGTATTCPPEHAALLTPCVVAARDATEAGASS